MDAVRKYKKRRADRLAERGIRPKISSNSENPLRIMAYQKRRDKRLEGRGLDPIEEKYDAFRLDADGDDQQNNNNSGSSGGGSHGNTRLPFGLCRRFGIEIEAGWTPRDAWDALAGKGITADGAYARLKDGKDPGTPDVEETGDTVKPPEAPAEATKEPEPPEEMMEYINEPVPNIQPVKTIKMTGYGYGGDEGAEYRKLKGVHVTWASRGREPWRLEAEAVPGSGEGYVRSRLWLSFWTKMDMYKYLKGKGVEEFEDPETGEIVNPKTMKIPDTVFTYDRAGFTALSLGLRDGKYTLIGTDFDGKKKKLGDFYHMGDAKKFVERGGGSMDDVKLSPALKKREKERVRWLESDKKEYITDETGEKYGDLKIERGYGGWSVKGESEAGEAIEKSFPTKVEAMQFLKDQGVEVVRERGEAKNPMEFEVPAVKFTIRGRQYQDILLVPSTYGEITAYGIDLDGDKDALGYARRSESLDTFKERMQRDYGIGPDDYTVSDDDKARIEEIDREAKERERRKREFEEKATYIPGHGKYMDPYIDRDSDGDFWIKGYDETGSSRGLTWDRTWPEMEKTVDRYGLKMEDLIKDEEIKKDYGAYLQRKKDFEEKAVDFGGEKYLDPYIEDDGVQITVKGYSIDGRRRQIAAAGSYEELEEELSKYGMSPTTFPMDDEAQKRKERSIKAREALASGGYYSFGRKDSAYRDIRVEEDGRRPDRWKIIGTDPDGNEHTIEKVDSWDDALTKMSDYDVKDYKIKDKSGKEIGKPKWGMHRVMLMRKPGGGFLVYADSDRYGKHAIMYETPKEEEARKWLSDNGVPESSVKTRGMNPNDDVPRTHTAKSLSGFDSHRMDKIEEYPILSRMPEATKVETAELLTEMFDKGAYRMNREDHFEEIVLDHFKNLLETGTSGGSSYKPGRRETGQKTFGEPERIKAIDAEKYGYWGLDDDKEDYDDSTAGHYGKIGFKFKKDRVGERATYTFGDTLDARMRISADRPLAGYAGSKPTIEGVSAFGDTADSLDTVLDDYREYKRGDISFNELHKRISRKCQDRYVECQFHGMLTIDDVDTITFPKKTMDYTFAGMTEDTRNKVLQKLRDCGTTIKYIDDNGEVKDGWERINKKYGGA